jgi:Family of unknown function (DUF6353)
MNTSNLLRQARQSFSKNSPTILSAAAIAGVVTTAILAVRGSASASESIQDALAEKNRTSDGQPWEDLSVFEEVKATWRPYFPAGLSGIATIACIIGANQIGLRRNAALLGAYTLADTAFREYKDEVLSQIGAARERKVVDELQKRKIDENPVTDAQIIITGGGEQLCYDSLTGRYFKSDIETIRRSENLINQQIVGGNMYASLNEFYSLLGLDSTTVGEELGWNLDNFIELIFTSHLAQDGRPCLAITYKRLPRPDYGKF